MRTADKNAEYKETLLRYYEEEIMGEAYFSGLVEHFSEQEKLKSPALVERRAADCVLPLIKKFRLPPREESLLTEKGIDWVRRHGSFDWKGLMTLISIRYPGYLRSFH